MTSMKISDAKTALSVVLLLAAPSVDAFPTFGMKIPNGVSVPCPDGAEGCNDAGVCLSLGHPACGGHRKGEDDFLDSNGTRVVNLNPFGEDWKASGFQWTRELCELDSDGDGYTNGEELGDPCCEWVQGRGSDGALNSVEGFVPSHPGLAGDLPPVDFVYDRAALCGGGVESGADANDEEERQEPEEDAASTSPVAADAHYNPGESRGEFEFRINPYEIPVEETTYVDFVFNLPDDLPDLVHIVFSEAIIDQPDHLHHFVVLGCPNRFEEGSQYEIGEAIPAGQEPADCTTTLGLWAPGRDVFGDTDNSTGIAFGRALGVEAIMLNVHYTDGAYEDPVLKTPKIATDGIRVHYTSDLRPYTTMRKDVVWIPFGQKEMFVPKETSRFFMTKTCQVGTHCQDASSEQLQMVASFLGLVGDDEGEDGAVEEANAAGGGVPDGMLANISCGAIKMFCFVENFGATVQQLCPVSCGLCEDGGEGAGENLRNPSSYRVTGVNYHAHLLGTEMYATLLREQEEDDQDDSSAVDVSVAKKKQASASSSAGAAGRNVMSKDLQSREVWFYDDQGTFPMDYEYEITIDADGSGNSNNELMQGVEVKPGDKIQITCVYNSMDRTEDTPFGFSTYEEMCIVSLYVTFETPPRNAAGGDDGAIDLITDLNLRLFKCEVDNENHTTDVWQGTLEEDEDPRNIYFDHPIDESDMCIFPVVDFVMMDVALSGETRNCPASVMEGEDDGNEKANENDETAPVISSNDNESPSAAAIVNAAGGVSKFLFCLSTLLLATMSTL